MKISQYRRTLQTKLQNNYLNRWNLRAPLFTKERSEQLDKSKHCFTTKSSKSYFRREKQKSKIEHETILHIQHIFTYLTHNNKDIIIAWVPSHQGLKSNEEADIAAKEATSPDVIRRRIPYQDLVVTLHHAEKQSWNKIWNTSKKKQKLII